MYPIQKKDSDIILVKHTPATRQRSGAGCRGGWIGCTRRSHFGRIASFSWLPRGWSLCAFWHHKQRSVAFQMLCFIYNYLKRYIFFIIRYRDHLTQKAKHFDSGIRGVTFKHYVTQPKYQFLTKFKPALFPSTATLRTLGGPPPSWLQKKGSQFFSFFFTHTSSINQQARIRLGGGGGLYSHNVTGQSKKRRLGKG
jgi:hypothetical protein